MSLFGMMLPLHDSEPKRLVHYAAMAYCKRQRIFDMSCRPCKKTSKNASVVAVTETDMDAHALIMIDHRLKEIVVSFRGLISLTNAQASFTFFRLDFENYSRINKTRQAGISGASVHAGFKKTADSLRIPIIKNLGNLLAQYNQYQVKVVGHSLGGAVATLMVIYIHQDLMIPFSQLTLVTYGQPRVGNVVFARWFNDLSLTAYRVVNENDPIPHLPSQLLGYSHTGTEMYIKDGITFRCPPENNLENPKCSNDRIPQADSSAHLNAWGISLQKEAC
ncbi:hypothetical protein L0F63_007313 [Massospora cicadina]|nr:hypothetical protein L0F63_007313 [Massospora cicadina]